MSGDRGRKRTIIEDRTCSFLCGKDVRQIAGKRQLLSKCSSEQVYRDICDAARTVNDAPTIDILANIQWHELQYHQLCKKEFIARAEKFDSGNNRVHDIAFDSIRVDLDRIVSTKSATLLTNLLCQYKRKLVELGHENAETYPSHRLVDRIRNAYEGQLTVSRNKNRKRGNFVHHVSMNFHEAQERTGEIPDFVINAAKWLRDKTLAEANNCPELSYPVNAEILAKGQLDTPPYLLHFFRTLYAGRERDNSSARLNRLSRSAADDAVYAISRGQIKPAKHLLLAITMKNITGQKRVVEILNRLGQCVGYQQVEVIETEMAEKVVSQDTPLPDSLKACPGLSTGTAWDNYDEMTETLTGAGQFHDVMGIAYQNVMENSERLSESDDDSDDTDGNTVTLRLPRLQQRSRASLLAPSNDLAPYHKRYRSAEFHFGELPGSVYPKLPDIVMKDVIWTLSTMCCPNTPSWAGWNSQFTNDHLPKQTIGYMKNMGGPATRNDIIVKTLETSIRVADECNEQTAIVTYDLGMARPAYQIQLDNGKRFARAFICIGPFHIFLAVFGSLGYLVDGSGLADIMVDSGVLSTGSVQGFIGGRHYNRCQRLHILANASLKSLHLKAFLQKTQRDITDELIQTLSQINTNPMSGKLDEIQRSSTVNELIQAYAVYCDESRRGVHGRTAQFWYIYIEITDIFLRVNRACRTNDVDLFIHGLGELLDLFHAVNRPQYKKWLTKYLLQLQTMDTTHPGVREALCNGALTIRRTPKNFTRIPVDQTVEMTVNADAASRRGGIASFNNSAATVQKWILNRSQCSNVVTALLDLAGLAKSQDVSRDLLPNRIRIFNNSLSALTASIESTMNPFDAEIAVDELYCLSNGKAVDEFIARDLTNVMKLGAEWRGQYVTECQQDPDRFNKPIRRRKIMNFVSGGKTVTLTSAKKQTMQLKCSRDLFGGLLYHACNKGLDIQEALRYPLTPVPLSVSEIDGTMVKTNKAKLVHKIEAISVSSDVHRDRPKVMVYDGMFIIQSTQLPDRYGQAALTILKRITTGPECHFVCDSYHPSIKDLERDERANEMHTNVKISGPEMKRPMDWRVLLRSSDFKANFLRFLVDEWSRQAYAEIIKHCELYVAIDQECYLFKVDATGTVNRTMVNDLCCDHNEADTRMIYHINYIVQSTTQNRDVCVRSNDTDVFVLALYYANMLDTVLLMDIGVSANNSRRVINISEMASSLGQDMTDAIVSLHAFSGNDYVSAFKWKGKSLPLDIMMKNDIYKHIFRVIGTKNFDAEDVMPAVESFICKLYSSRSSGKISELRYQTFQRTFKPQVQRNGDKTTYKLKGADASTFPPSLPAVKQHLFRAHFVSSVWKRCLLAKPDIGLDPCDWGWKFEDGKYTINWYDGPMVPPSLMNELTDYPNSNESECSDDSDVDVDSSDEEDDDE